MRREEQPDEPANRRSRLLIGLVVAIPLLLLLGLVLVSQLEPKEGDASSVTALTGGSRGLEAPTSTIDTRDEVVARLHSIFRARDQAIQTRNPSILNGIYTIDCPCLKGDRALIEGLKKSGLVWRGIKVDLVVEKTEQVNERLWIISALVKTSSFNIERESGETVRSVPSGQEHSRFALARPTGQEEWLLGRASVTAERG